MRFLAFRLGLQSSVSWNSHQENLFIYISVIGLNNEFCVFTTKIQGPLSTQFQTVNSYQAVSIESLPICWSNLLWAMSNKKISLPVKEEELKRLALNK